MKRLVLGVVAAAGVLLASGPESVAGFLSGDAAQGPSQRLKTVFADYWTEYLRADPLEATFVGDHRFDDRLADPSEPAHKALIERYRALRTALGAIAPAGLSRDERIDRDVLIATLDDVLEGEPFRNHLIPMTQQEGLHLKFAQSVNFHPVGTVGDVENYVRRLRGFARAVDATIGLMKQGIAEKRVPPRITMEKVVPQLRALASPKPEESPLYAIVARLPRDWSDADRERVTAAVRGAIVEAVIPAYAKLAEFVEREYLPSCRESIGLCDTPDGPPHYAYRARSFTTTNLTPAEIHEIGLAEMARNRAGMDTIRQKVGFAGDLKAFFKHVKSDPKLKNTSEAEIIGRYTSIFAVIDAKLPTLFGRLPKTDYAIRPIEAYRARAASAGYYYPAPDDGSRPGYFYVNTYEPKSRSTYTMQALAYHEGVPGHHLQFSLGMEAPGRPAFRRFGYFSAFSEGWGLYSEGLPAEIGLYPDPYADFGRLEFNAWRCGRLVVDTGIHEKHWSRDQTIAYLEANTAVPRLEIESEVDRYIAWPGQALSYKIGELRIRALRAREERRLGAQFDLRAFHDRLLAHGSVPFTVLERYLTEEPGSAR
jgi:uncharacterized protein (DUF885 family)